MKLLVCFVAFLAVTSASEKTVAKRGIYGGYGHGYGAAIGAPIGLHSYSAPIIRSYAAPVIRSYAAPIHHAPIIYRAPIVHHAPILHHAPLIAPIRTYAAPISLGYSSYHGHGHGLGYGYRGW